MMIQQILDELKLLYAEQYRTQLKIKALIDQLNSITKFPTNE